MQTTQAVLMHDQRSRLPLLLVAMLVQLFLRAAAQAVAPDASLPSDWEEDASAEWAEESLLPLREQHVAQETLLDSAIVWVLLNPKEFLFAVACVLVPLFALAAASAVLLIRNIDKSEREEREELEDRKQSQAQMATAATKSAVPQEASGKAEASTTDAAGGAVSRRKAATAAGDATPAGTKGKSKR